MNLKKKPFSELVIGIICMVLGAAVFIAAGNLQTVKLGIGPAGMPKFVSVLLMVLGTVIMIPAYPIYRKIAQRTKAELTPEILRLSEEIIKSAKN